MSERQRNIQLTNQFGEKTWQTEEAWRREAYKYWKEHNAHGCDSCFYKRGRALPCDLFCCEVVEESMQTYGIDLRRDGAMRKPVDESPQSSCIEVVIKSGGKYLFFAYMGWTVWSSARTHPVNATLILVAGAALGTWIVGRVSRRR